MNFKGLGHLVRSQQAAEWMDMSRSTFYSKVKRGELPGPAYRMANSVAWDTSELDKAKERMLKKCNKEAAMQIKNNALAIQDGVLTDLLQGQTMNHASIDKYKKEGMNITMQHVIASLRDNYNVIIQHSPKNSGYWYITKENANEYQLNPRSHCARKVHNAAIRSQLRRENAIVQLCEKHPKKVAACLASKLNQPAHQ
ncbi:helix-turn-helix transcriptional regulator [Vibrio rotiferianus]|uniref:helix-turn-helix transcriptional regulator n=1 Tax=Vibrio rotiferianus TaxID=190895 RepID=UPI00406A871C